MIPTARPSSTEEAADTLAAAARGGRLLRFVGGGTKLGWGTPGASFDLHVSTRGLEGVVEHNAADLTAVVRAGTPLRLAQEVFAGEGQMLPLDPPLGEGAAATIGGVVASGDSGPLRHRYGGARDLLLGMTVVLSDGTIARTGGKVIKNVAGYDLAKLFSGSMGTLGLISEMVVRLRPRPPRTVTAVGESDEPEALRRAATAIAHAQLEPESLDVAWASGGGSVLARASGVAPDAQAKRLLSSLEKEGLDARALDDDDALWMEQRNRQRSSNGAVLRVSGLLSALDDVLRAAESVGGSVVGRAALGLYWVKLEGGDPSDLVAAIEAVRERLRDSTCVVLDAPEDVRSKVDVWDVGAGPELELMRRVKARFDPSGTCAPGTFVGGL